MNNLLISIQKKQNKRVIFFQQMKSKRGLIELNQIRCAEIVKSGGEIIPCPNKYPFQVYSVLFVALEQFDYGGWAKCDI